MTTPYIWTPRKGHCQFISPRSFDRPPVGKNRRVTKRAIAAAQRRALRAQERNEA